MASVSPFSSLLILLLLLPVPALAQIYRNITLGLSLTAATNNGAPWTSPSGDFAFGFQQIEAAGGKFLLAVWFNKIPEKTVVWSVNGGNLVSQGSTIQLGSDGRFLLNNPAGQEIWRAMSTGSDAVAYAAMLDTGNFVLASQDGGNLWETFNNPTDTLLPTQVFKQGSRLAARFSETNYSTGRRYELRMETDGNFVLDRLQMGYYWEAETRGTGNRLAFNQSGSIEVVGRNGSLLRSIAPPSSTGRSGSQFYQRAILEYDGVFREYVYPKTDRSGVMKWSTDSFVPPNICLTSSAVCGFNSYCSLGDDQRPECECPPGYSLLDRNDHAKGCKHDFVLQECNGSSQDADNFEFRDVLNTDWPNSDYESYQPASEDSCRQICLVDCFCNVAFYGNGGCYKKTFPLLNGQPSTISGKALIKVRKDNSSNRPTGIGGSKRIDRSILIIVGSLLGSSMVVNLLFLIWVFFGKKRKLRLHPMTQGINWRCFSYQELEEATSNFKEEIGRGAFSTVYRGSLDEGGDKVSIAIKKLDKMVTENEHEFQAEMCAIGRTNHKNLVQLLGFCNEGEHRLLVYEYMSNGSLANHLFGETRPTWSERVQIALAIARGLVYLHQECSNQIIHCDIKPQNVLLDESFNARISDFGLAKLLKTDQTRTLTAIRGTKGYVAPEWFKSRPITTKVDVYSFGILLLELICCRKKFKEDAEEERQMVLADWAYDCYEEKKTYLLVQIDQEAIQDASRVEKFVMVAIWCIHDDPTMRPTMKKVLQMLEGEAGVPPPPLYSDSSLEAQ